MNNYYTYLIGWSSINRWYYGCQYGKNSNPNNLWTNYFTSSKVVKDCRAKYGEPDIIEIRKTFSDKNKCLDWEHRVLEKLNVSEQVKWLNKKSGTGKSITTTVNVKCSVTGIYIGPVEINHSLYLSGDYIPFNRGVKKGPSITKGRSKPRNVGKTVVSDKNGVFYSVSVNDPRIVSGELTHWLKTIAYIKNIITGEIIQHTRAKDLPEGFCHLAKGKTNVKDKDGNKFQVSSADKRILSGELIPVHKGKKMKNPELNSRKKEANGKWSGKSDKEYLETLRECVSKNPNLRWAAISKLVNLPSSRTHLREIIEQEFNLPTYNNRKRN